MDKVQEETSSTLVDVHNHDLLKSDATYIVHQCNCRTTRAAGLSLQLFSKFPYANTYCSSNSSALPHHHRREPGTIHILGNGTDKRFVVNLYGQVHPGKPRPSQDGDSAAQRLDWFITGLNLLAQEINAVSAAAAAASSGKITVAFPERIGCGLAGGDWEAYRDCIQQWAFDNEHIVDRVYIIHRAPAKAVPTLVATATATATAAQPVCVNDDDDVNNSDVDSNSDSDSSLVLPQIPKSLRSPKRKTVPKPGPQSLVKRQRVAAATTNSKKETSYKTLPHHRE